MDSLSSFSPDLLSNSGYNGENEDIQLGFLVTDVNKDGVKEAWDEPLTRETGLDIENSYLSNTFCPNSLAHRSDELAEI